MGNQGRTLSGGSVFGCEERVTETMKKRTSTRRPDTRQTQERHTRLKGGLGSVGRRGGGDGDQIECGLLRVGLVPRNGFVVDRGPRTKDGGSQFLLFYNIIQVENMKS